MTQTMQKRFSRTSSPPHVPAFEGRAMRPHTRRDAAEMAATLRSLATRAHQAVKAFETRQHRLAGSELTELVSAICQLEDDFRKQELHHLVPYVAALRHQVQTRLA
jgi:hypothetical protein